LARRGARVRGCCIERELGLADADLRTKEKKQKNNAVQTVTGVTTMTSGALATPAH
jgi:hypothetical protein